MRALVTGGAGFVGSTLVDRLLAEGHAVDVVDDLSSGRLANLNEARADRSAELHIHHLDVTTPEAAELVARRQPEVVYHLAGGRRADPAAEAVVEIVGALRVLDGARRGGARKVVTAGSASMYGPLDAAALPARESEPQLPLTTAGVAKKAVNDYLRMWREVHGLEFTVLVLANVYGPRQRPQDGVVAAFAQSLLGGSPGTVDGDGNQTRDFVYVDDVVDAFVRAADKGGGLQVNVGTGIETSVAELYRTMADAAGGDAVAALAGPRREGDPERIALQPGRSKIHLGWAPWTPLGEGVAQVLSWFATSAPAV